MDIQFAVNEWQNREQEILKQTQEMALKYYEKARKGLSKKHQEILQRAITQRYLVMPPHGGVYASNLKSAYTDWCRAHGQPTLIVWPADRYKANNVQMLLDLDSLRPWGSWNLYQPDLDENDETFHLMMLLCNEWSWSQGHVHLRYVNIERFNEVAQQLLAYYDRCYQKNLERLKPFLK